MELRHIGKKGMRWGHRKAQVQTQAPTQTPSQHNSALEREKARQRSMHRIDNSLTAYSEKELVRQHYKKYGEKSTEKLLERMDKKHLTTEQAVRQQEMIEYKKRGLQWKEPPRDYKKEARNRSMDKIIDSPTYYHDKGSLIMHYNKYGRESVSRILEAMDAKNLTLEQAINNQVLIEKAKTIFPSLMKSVK